MVILSKNGGPTPTREAAIQKMQMFRYALRTLYCFVLMLKLQELIFSIMCFKLSLKLEESSLGVVIDHVAKYNLIIRNVRCD